MREILLQTPQKDHTAANRRSKSASVHNKKLQKVSPKILNSAFSPSAEDALGFESPKCLIDSSWEICDDNFITESTEEYPVSPTPGSAITYEAVVSPEISPSSSVIDEPRDGTSSSISQNETAMQEAVRQLSSAEVEVLREAQVQVSESKDEVLNALVKICVAELFQSPVKKDWFDVIMSKKGYLAVLCLLLWTIAVFLTISDLSHSKYGGLVPT